MQQTLVLTPLKIELKLLKDQLQSKDYLVTELKIKHTIAFEVKSLNLIFGLGGHGKVDFALQTLLFLHAFPSLTQVICAGAAGKLNPKLNPLDIIAATQTIEHDYKNYFCSSKPSPQFPGDSILLTKLKNINKKLNTSLFFGPIASGDEDVIDINRANQLYNQTKAYAVAWEGAGGARACQLMNKAFLELRGITDLSNQNAQHDFVKNLEAVMKTISELLIALLDNKSHSF